MFRITPHHRGATPFQRIPIVSLLVSFVALTAISPGRSASTYESFQLAVSQFVRMILIFIGLAAPSAKTAVGPVAATLPATSVVQGIRPIRSAESPNTMVLRRDPAFRRYTYVFEGKATYQKQPCPNASVLVRLISGETTVAQGAVTELDGSYSLQVAIDAAPDSPVDWTMEAYTPDFKKVEMTGRRIVEREEENTPVVVTTPVEFLASLPRAK